jgi:NADH-quinone oxidoreductase subunit M
MTTLPVLTILTLLPLGGGLATLIVGSRARNCARAIALLSGGAALALVAAIWTQFDASGGLQFEERWHWLPALGIDYHLAVDGLALPLLLLSALVVGFAIVASRKEGTAFYYALLLFVEAGLFGVFTALNFFHWFIFWELSLVPAFFLIRFGGRPAQNRAALQFFIYTMTGSVAMLLSFIALYSAAGTFDFIELAAKGTDSLKAAHAPLTWIFGGVLLGLVVKVPMMPFHTWLPAAYAEAPTGAAMVLTGALSKMGVYGLLRILLPIFPEQTRAMLTPLLWLAVATIIFSAAAAFAQKDLKRIVAYSSINHLGYCLLGVFAAAQWMGAGTAWTTEKAAALNGVVLQMFNHGITAASLFYFVGLIEQRSGGARSLEDFGGLRRAAPILAGLMGITVFASLGLPGLNGFVGEFLIFKGVFSLAGWAAAASVLGLLITAVFLLTMLERVFHGPQQRRWDGWSDLTTGERWTVAPAIALMFVLGVFPQLIIGICNPAVMQLISQIKV